MAKNKIEEFCEQYNVPFLALDFCNLCDGYDTIQSYIMDETGLTFHVCEKCATKYKQVDLIRLLKRKYHK